jgi:hypothetical protein
MGYSVDGGLTWALGDQSGACAGLLEGITSCGGSWVVVGSNEQILRSTDGQHWQFATGDWIPGDLYDLETVACDDSGLWVAGCWLCNPSEIFSELNLG